MDDTNHPQAQLRVICAQLANTSNLPAKSHAETVQPIFLDPMPVLTTSTIAMKVAAKPTPEAAWISVLVAFSTNQILNGIWRRSQQQWISVETLLDVTIAKIEVRAGSQRQGVPTKSIMVMPVTPALLANVVEAQVTRCRHASHVVLENSLRMTNTG